MSCSIGLLLATKSLVCEEHIPPFGRRVFLKKKKKKKTAREVFTYLSICWSNFSNTSPASCTFHWGKIPCCPLLGLRGQWMALSKALVYFIPLFCLDKTLFLNLMLSFVHFPDWKSLKRRDIRICILFPPSKINF